MQTENKTRRYIKASLQFFNQTHIQQVIQLFSKIYVHQGKATIQEFQKNQLHIRKLLVHAAKGNWSFILQQNEKIVGASINLDLVDYLTLFQTQFNIGDLQLFNFGNPMIRSYFYKLKPSRGEYIYSMETLLDQCKKQFANKAQYIGRGLVLCRTAGWNNILIAQSSPYIFLRMGGKVIQQFSQDQGKQKIYLTNLKLKELLITKGIENQPLAKL